MAALGLDGVSKRFPDGTVAVHPLDLTVDDGELMVLVGPSGCGKSTVLRMVAGLETPSEGTISIGGRPANDLSPGMRDVAMVFQDYALYPHMTVHHNIAFALKAKRLPRHDIDARVSEVARLLGIEDLLGRRPRALSGGERQRVAMGRAIVRRPAAFLMDEPLSNLDAKLRVELRTEIRRLHRELATTFLYVTHDQVEAMTMGDRVAVLRQGQLQQLAAPQEVYAAPASVFVAAFMGSPAMNLLRARLISVDGRTVARAGPWDIPLAESLTLEHDEIVVGFRPEHLEPVPTLPMDDDASVAEVGVEVVEPLGSVTLVHFHVNANPVAVLDERSGDGTLLSFGEKAETPLVASVDGRVGLTAAAAGARLRLRIDPGAVRYFHPVTGLAL
ncbi:MAG TPA: sn-glycerol-3-phosphate ABC transporter ATP-binding protein UgpC [Acidimicrobiales bacterium]|nr:sn-glycerol-3-phosphate ABC transporter ATP-binding protein UgpC [Acidimicrobiales bacterium]